MTSAGTAALAGTEEASPPHDVSSTQLAAARQDVAWPGGAATTSRVWPAGVLSSVLVAGLLLLLFLRNHRYFFLDDRIAEIVPKGLDIGRMVRRGEAPWLSTDIVNGGGYAVEYLMGVFNPVNLLLYAVSSLTDDAAFGSFIYVLGHALLLTASAAWLARTVGLGTAWSIAFAVSVGFQPYTILWNATAWSQGLVSFSWVVLAIAAGSALHLRQRRRYGWLLLFGVVGTLTGGWPHAVFILGVFVAALIVARLWARCPLRGTVWIAVWAAGGAVVSLVAIYPLLTSFEVATRSSSTSNLNNANVVPLEGLLHFADPAYYGFFFNFDGYVLQPLPHFYVAWFALPILVLVAPRRLPAAIRPLVMTTLSLLAVSVFAALGPELLLVFRYPTRVLQYTAFFLLLLVALLVAHGAFCFSRRRLGVLLALVAGLVLNTLQTNPAGYRRSLAAGLVLAVLCASVWLLGRPDLLRSDGLRRAARLLGPAGVVLSTVAVLAGLAVQHPQGRGFDSGFPHDLTTLKPVSRDDYTLFHGNYAPVEVYSEFRPATTGLMVGDRQVNGYSSLGNRYLRTFLAIDDQGNLALGAPARFTATDAATGLSWLELLRVDQVVALLGPYDDDARASLDPAMWRREQGTYTATYRRAAAYPLPGLVSWTSKAVDVTGPACERTALRECLRVAAPDGGQVQFARLLLPGYRATLDGKELELIRASEAFVAVVLPPGADGTLELRYSPPGLRPLSTLAAVVLVLLMFASWRWHGSRQRRSRRFRLVRSKAELPPDPALDTVQRIDHR